MIVESIHYINIVQLFYVIGKIIPLHKARGLKKQVNGLTNQSFYNIVCNLLVL
ncbi:hypothetical protein EJ73_00014 [Hoylesella shahii DSM 15611 = JCM 12083]|uniref:Uncharacterized protein n=1 Tax=Hoylesella shahii DSM 15611 = JCM 12083 TaxID=1122991 RepID=A0A318I2B6_9BACT|nr:hypothetical protein EJ73_00014 [Hoylesella shahii DSM 15611 = JCM 12083]